MKTIEIISIISMLALLPLIAMPFFGTYILDMWFHATMLLVAWPTLFVFLFLVSIISEIME